MNKLAILSELWSYIQKLMTRDFPGEFGGFLLARAEKQRVGSDSS